MTYILQCPNCGKMFKCEGHVSVNGLQYITDFNDNVTNYCVCCHSKMTPKIMQTQPWIADCVFTVKGEIV